jgi:hypothetical protein
MWEHCTIETSVLIARLEHHSYNTTNYIETTDFTIYAICCIRSDTNREFCANLLCSLNGWSWNIRFRNGVEWGQFDYGK